MIKPFQILQSRTEADGTTGVIVKVWKVTAVSMNTTKTEGMQCYMQIPAGQNADEYLFDQFSKAGWF